MIKFIILLMFIGFAQYLSAQEPVKKEKADSAKFYKSLQELAKKKSFSKWLFSMIFTIPERTNRPPKRLDKRVTPRAYHRYENKVIRNIEILTLDPFGYDIRDTSIRPSGFLRTTGNKLHIKTLPIAIKNLLLFSSNQPFDSLLVKESERLIRKQKYVHDVIFSHRVVNKDSVDIQIRVLDIWSLTPRGSLSTSVASLGFTDQNFLGTGQQFDNIYARNLKSRRNAYELSYYIPNIRHSYIGSRIKYQINEDQSFIKTFEIERPFFSTFARWGGGIYFGQQLTRDSIIFPDSTQILQNFKYNTQDAWLGKSWRVAGGKSEIARTTNFVVAGRFQHINYLEKPPLDYDSLKIYSGEKNLFLGLGFVSRQYIQDTYIFKYGLVEDVPKGAHYSITAGYQEKNNKERFYLGVKSSWGDYYRWGYFGTLIEYGRFIHKGNFQEGAIHFSVNYFSDLMTAGKWKIRQFVKPQLILGIKRLPTDKLSLNDSYGITGFTANNLHGIHKILITFQTQSYAPWDLIGFRFGPYAVYTMGFLGNYNSGFRKSRIYSLLGLGVLVKNEFLVFKTFEISVSFYPIIPGKGKNISKFNTYRTNDFGFREFDIEKPTTVTYQ